MMKKYNKEKSMKINSIQLLGSFTFGNLIANKLKDNDFEMTIVNDRIEAKQRNNTKVVYYIPLNMAIVEFTKQS